MHPPDDPPEVVAVPPKVVDALGRALAQSHRMPDAAPSAEDPAYRAWLAARKRLLQEQATRLQLAATDHGPTAEHSAFALQHLAGEARPDGLEVSAAPATNGNGQGPHPEAEESPV